VGAGLLAGNGAVGVGWELASKDDEGDADEELRRCGGAASAAELQAQIAVGAFVGFGAGAVEVRRIHRHGEQQRRYRKEGNELACSRMAELVEHSAHLTALISGYHCRHTTLFRSRPGSAAGRSMGGPCYTAGLHCNTSLDNRNYV
jgi:hypothetical protein